MRTRTTTKTTERIYNAFDGGLHCSVGTKPESDRMENGRHCFRSWQGPAFWKLFNVMFAILNAPTGSGKSAVQKALAWTYARLGNGERTIIAVPETIIGASFNTEADGYILPNDITMDWTILPENYLFGDRCRLTESSKVKHIVDFVTGRLPVTAEGRILVCTHAALVAAHKALIKKFGKSAAKMAWRGVNIFIDEAHHSKAMSEMAGEQPVPEDVERCNQLGKIVDFYVNHRPGRLLLTTATWLRGDSMTIVPPEHMDKFGTYELAIDAYLDTMEYLRNITFKFSMCDTYEEALHTAILTAPHKNTLVYLPHVMPGQGGEVLAKKLVKYKKAIGKPIRGGDPLTPTYRTAAGKDVTVIDLVTVKGRDEVKACFQEMGDKMGSWTTLLQNLGREGMDSKAAERSIVFGARGSLTMLIQMVGRLLRDFRGKSSVEFHIVLRREVTEDIGHFSTYADAILTTMALGWSFQSRLARSQEVVAGVKAALKAAIVSSTPNGQPPLVAVGGILKGVVEALGRDHTDEEIEASSKTLLEYMKGSFRLAAQAIEENLTTEQALKLNEEIETDPFGAMRKICKETFTAEGFRKICEAYAKLPELTPEYVDQLQILHRCKAHQHEGYYVDPRVIPGIASFWPSKEAFETALQAEGL